MLAAVLALSGCASLRHELRHVTASSEEKLADDVTIERDEYGVPHIHGRSDAAVAFGLGYAMAEDNYWQVEEDMLLSLGWASNYWGERYLAHDLVRTAYRVAERAQAEYAAAPREQQQLWSAFTQGLNYYLRTHSAAPRRLLTRYEPWMILAHAYRFDVHTAAGGVALGGIAQLLEVDAEPPYASPGPDRSWALAVPAERSASGHALLLAALDAPYFGPGQLYEAELRSGQGWHAAGVAVLGTPVLLAGHNAQLAWTHTPDAEGAVLLRVAADSVRERIDTVRVNTASGVVARAYRFLETAHGPAAARRGDTVFVVQPASGEGVFQRRYQVSRAASLETLRSIVDGSRGAGVHVIAAHVNGSVLRTDSAVVTSQQWSLEALERAAFDTNVPEATSQITALVDEWERVGGSNPRRAFALDSAIDVLRQWDRRFTGSSAAAWLYHRWQEELARTQYVEGRYGRFRALESVLAAPPRTAGAPHTWGEAQRLQRRHTSGAELFLDSLPSLPLTAAPAAAAAAFTVSARRDLGWRRYAVHGRAWTAITELASPPHARTVVPFGQSADPASRHFFDQARLFTEGRLKELPFGDAAVRAHVRERYHPGQRARVLQH